MSLYDALEALLAATLAPPCAACGGVLDHPLSGAVCERCWSACVAEPARIILHDATTVLSLGPYEGTLRNIIHALKYDGRRSIARPLAHMLLSEGRDLLRDAHFVVPVPLHRRRQRERGFNQSAAIAAHLGRPVLNALRRVTHTRPQVGLDAHERRANVDNAFALRPAWQGGPWPTRRARDGIANRVLVLVDDVATTGATLAACAQPLRAAGAADVRALTAARVVTVPR